MMEVSGAIGFDGLVEGMVACPGPGSWINCLEKIQLPILNWQWLPKLS